MGNLLSLCGGVLAHEFDWQRTLGACAAAVSGWPSQRAVQAQKVCMAVPSLCFRSRRCHRQHWRRNRRTSFLAFASLRLAGRRSGAACIPCVSTSLRRPVLAATLQGSILTFVRLRLDWAAEPRRAAALMASHTTGARDIDAAPLRPGKASLEDELDA